MEIWRKLVGPYKVLVKLGVNYKVESQHGKVLVVHHNQLKLCPLSLNDEGKDICPVSKPPDCRRLMVTLAKTLGK